MECEFPPIFILYYGECDQAMASASLLSNLIISLLFVLLL